MSGRFADVPEAPKDPILGISEMFVADSHPEKMNLGVVRVERFRRRRRRGGAGGTTGRREGDARCVTVKGLYARREKMID